MNTYCDIKYYKDNFVGDKLITEEKELEKYLKYATDKINEVTYNRISSKGLSNLSIFQQEKIKNAVCYQANYFYEYGLEKMNINSYGVLDINISFSDVHSNSCSLGLSDMAYSNLKQTGLLSQIL